MNRPRRDSQTPDLFRDFTPPPVVDRYEIDRVRAATTSMRVARAVSEALKGCGRSRDVVAGLMSEYLGEPVPVSMLEAYASAARDKHNIPAHRLIALAVVTRDARLVNALLAETSLIAVDEKYEALIRREMAKEARDRIEREIAAADAQWRAGR
jgi:hypothetical protein